MAAGRRDRLSLSIYIYTQASTQHSSSSQHSIRPRAVVVRLSPSILQSWKGIALSETGYRCHGHAQVLPPLVMIRKYWAEAERKCAVCQHRGAQLKCHVGDCTQHFHYSCASTHSAVAICREDTAEYDEERRRRTQGSHTLGGRWPAKDHPTIPPHKAHH